MKESNGANLGFEQTLWKAADKLRNNMDAVEYKHVGPKKCEIWQEKRIKILN